MLAERKIAPIEMVVLQGTPFCNLNCSYCYLGEATRRNTATMQPDVLKAIFERILGSRYIDRALRVSWHSGEPMVLKPSYYREAIGTILELRDALCGPDFGISFDLQTNGTLITQEWCDFLKELGDIISIGISCDGPAFLHDAHRLSWTHKPTHQRTLAGMELMRRNGLRFDAIAVLSRDGLAHPEAFVNFFAQYADSIRDFHFNLHDELDVVSMDPGSVDAFAAQYGDFLRRMLAVYARWGIDGTRLSIRNFASFYERIFSAEADKPRYDARSMSMPFRTLNVMTNGDVSTFYAGLTGDECGDLYGDGRGLLLGNLLSDDLDAIAGSGKLARIAADFEASHAACEHDCEYFDLCAGGYNLVKFRRYADFTATRTPECFVHVQTFTDTLLDDMNRNARSSAV
ncbi:Anaerobic sulfatase-maturating enzyme [Caballeronia arationis]|uniref:radical SAM protein n=1 Tax=Caballeronia arationis TaxID=1777142 RepID=UPI00074BB617|nr:radical SAM protein [Caballeronia arationis]SAL04291.1 Anaerobic sulfatase-maturating enzyme [Caballeronia arationis]